jgi:alpha-L-fucosidase
MGGHGDFSTQEQALLAKPPAGPWELCVTINDSWGFKAHDDNFKSVRQLVQLFVEVFAGGGNLLLDAGPMEDGVIPEIQAERLRGLGAWISRNEEAVYETERGLGFGYFDGPTALSPDRKTLYLYLFGLPQEFVVVKGLTTSVARARVVGTGTPLDHQRVGGLHRAAGWEYVFVDHATHAADMDPICTVIACEFDEPLELAPTDWAFD